MNNTELKEHALRCFKELDEFYPDYIEFLETENAFQMLVAVVLSARTTDRQVSVVIPELFERFPDAEALGNAPQAEVEDIIKSVGFYRSKASNIIRLGEMLHQEFGGVVPDTMEALLQLPGCGRKTANVILGKCFSKPAIIVDTHFGRVVRRLGLTEQSNPDKVETEIKKLIPDEKQYRFSMTANLHGREYCKSQKPLCNKCFMKDLCLWGA
jgi:endonuclease-3